MSAKDITLLSPDLVILDIIIQVYAKTGSQICADLKALIPPNGIPALLLSAEKEIAELAKVSNCDYYISKPFDVDFC